MAQTDGGVVEDYADAPADQPPTIISTPAPMFTEGTADTYDMTQHVTDDGLSTVTYSIVTILPNGLSFNTSTGILTYDGSGTPSVSVHQLKATDDAGTATSSNFNIEIHADVTIDTIPNITMYVGIAWGMAQYINDTLNRRTATRVTGLPAEITYDDVNEQLNASSAKFVTGVQLEVDYP